MLHTMILAICCLVPGAAGDADSLHQAAAAGDRGRVKTLISQGIDVDARDEFGRTALHRAAENGHRNTVEYLLDQGADINAQDTWLEYTALLWAIACRHGDTARYLISKGGNLNLTDSGGRTPLHYAARGGLQKVAEMLLDKGADVNATDTTEPWRWTPLQYAADAGHLGVAELLIAHGADFKVKRNDGSTLLHLAVASGHKGVAQLLMSKKADINARDRWRRTPLDLALVLGADDIAQLLIAAGADTNIHVMRAAKGVSLDVIQDLTSLSVQRNDVQTNASLRDAEKVEFPFRAAASDITVFPAPKGREYLEIKGLTPIAMKGVPQLPVKTFVVKLPRRSRVYGVTIPEGKVARLAHQVTIVPALGSDPFRNVYGPSEAIYGQDKLYPGRWVRYELGSNNHSTFVFVRLFPVQYNPKRKQVHVMTECKLALHYGGVNRSDGQPTPARAAGGTRPRRTDARNLIICPGSLATAAGELRDFHAAEGMQSTVVALESIVRSYRPAEEPPCKGFTDEPPEGRAELKQYNSELARQLVAYLRDMDTHPRAEYVTLLGNALLIPPSYYAKNLSARRECQGWLATDFYYASPDYDAVPNFCVGRLPVDNPREAMRVVRKIRRWYDHAEWSWFQKVYVGSRTGLGDIYKHGERTLLETIRRGRFEDMDLHVFLQSRGEFDREHLEPALAKGGVGFVYLLAHEGEPFTFPYEPIREYCPRTRVPVVIHIGCSAGAFDRRHLDPAWSHYPEARSFGETVLVSKAGGIGFFGFSSVSAGCPHLYFDRGHVRVAHLPYAAGILDGVFAAYRQGEKRLGDLYSTTLFSFVKHNYVAGDVDNLRSVLTFVLLGDPALKIPVQPGRRQNLEKQAVSLEPARTMKRFTDGRQGGRSTLITPGCSCRRKRGEREAAGDDARSQH